MQDVSTFEHLEIVIEKIKVNSQKERVSCSKKELGTKVTKDKKEKLYLKITDLLKIILSSV